MITGLRFSERVYNSRQLEPKEEGRVHATPPVLRFGVFELNLGKEELRKFGTLIKLSPQPFKLLALLASQAGQVVTREQIQLQLWGEDTFVDFEQGMNHCIRQIRNALSDNADTPRYIETLPRRGYRFIAPVEVMRPELVVSLVTLKPDPPPQEPVAGIPDVVGHKAAIAAAPALTVMEVSAAPTTRAPATTSQLRWVLAGVAGLVMAVAAVGAYRIVHGRMVPQSSSPDLKHRPAVAVLGFKNLAGHPDTGIPLSTAITTMLGTELAAGDQLRIVPSAEVERLRIEMHLADVDSLPSDTLKRLHKSLAADYVVLGSYMEEGGQVRLDLRVQDTSQGDFVTSFKEDGPSNVSGLAELVSSAGANIRPKLGVPAVSAMEASGIRATRPSESAAELYYQGLAKLRTFDALAARELLQKAVAAEPDFAPAHSALAEALNKLGYSKLARVEAEKAFGASADLPLQERLLIEAQYSELTRKWAQAIGLYQKLWDSGHNNVDYGLKLARAQTKAGKAQAALGTVQELRGLPAPERDDLRIDLEEAEAKYALGEYDAEQAAADQAARKAESLGGGFALSRARTAQVKALFYRGHLDDALAMFRESLATSQVLGDKGEIASSLNNMGGVMQEQGNLAAALELHAKALAAFREIGNQNSAAATMSNMGAVYQLEGELGDAMKMYQQALDIYSELGDLMNKAIVINNIGEVSFLTGNLGIARQRHEEAMVIDREIKNRSTEADALFGMGQVLAAQGDLAASRRAHEKALEIRVQLKDQESLPESRLALGGLALAVGNAPAAEAAARAEAQSVELHDQKVRALILLARALLAQSKMTDAQQAISQAQSLSTGVQNRVVHLDLELASAQVVSRSDNAARRAEATQKLESILSEAAKREYVQIQFGAMLALAEAEIRAGNSNAGLAQLATLRKQAATRGFGLMARQAAAAEKRPKAVVSSDHGLRLPVCVA